MSDKYTIEDLQKMQERSDNPKEKMFLKNLMEDLCIYGFEEISKKFFESIKSRLISSPLN